MEGKQEFDSCRLKVNIVDIKTVVDNLRRTILGKERLLDGLNPDDLFSEEYLDEAEVLVRRTMIEFLKINIEELKRILQDIEQIS